MAQAIIANSRQVFLAADHTKFGRNAMVRLGGLEDVDALFTDMPPPPPLQERIEAAEVALFVAEPELAGSRLSRRYFRLRKTWRSDTKSRSLSSQGRSTGGKQLGQQVDLLIVGGGINGAGIARDAAGRGLSVLLAEKDDLASHTSRWSSKLIHGGLRYLEYYEFRLGPRGADRARGPAARRTAHRLAAHLRPAAQPGAASGLADPAGPPALRPSGRPPDPAGLDLGRPDPPRPAERPAPALGQARLHLFGLLGRGQPARGAQRHGRGRARRRDPHQDPVRSRPTRRRRLARRSRRRQRAPHARSRRARWSTPPGPGYRAS